MAVRVDMASPTANILKRPSKRERNKQEKRDRILAAARDAFRSRGYDQTTLREVAAAAGIGTGTLFLYAETKEALLVLVFKDELGPVFDHAFETVPAGDLLSQFLHVFSIIIEHHARDPAIARPFARELLVIGPNERSALLGFVQGWHAQATNLVAGGLARGEVDPAIAAEALSSYVLDLFLAGLRRWMTDRISRADCERELREGLAILLAGATVAARPLRQGMGIL